MRENVRDMLRGRNGRRKKEVVNICRYMREGGREEGGKGGEGGEGGEGGGGGEGKYMYVEEERSRRGGCVAVATHW